jgi:ribosome biogenesis GTPase
LGVIVGPSGVGKSSLINAINTERGTSTNGTHVEEEEEVETAAAAAAAVEGGEEEGDELEVVELLDVGEVSARTGRGKHTTRNISLIKLSNGGLLADTPGFNQPHLLGVTPRELSKCFPEIVQRLQEGGGKCAFKNCAHIHEPGCLVRGEWERYPMYVDMYDQVKLQESQALKTGSNKESRQGDSKKKSKQGGKVKAEPRLNKKKHRRTSRKLSKQQFKQAIREEEDFD